MTTVMNLAYVPLVMEECGEVLQAMGKCVRFGPERIWIKEGYANHVVLAYEVGGLIEVLEHLALPIDLVRKGRLMKKEKLKTFGPDTWTPEIGDATAQFEKDNP